MPEQLPEPNPDFSAAVSRPRARRIVRIIIYILLLALACASIWWIDRGAMMTNTHPSVAPTSQK